MLNGYQRYLFFRGWGIVIKITSSTLNFESTVIYSVSPSSTGKGGRGTRTSKYAEWSSENEEASSSDEFASTSRKGKAAAQNKSKKNAPASKSNYDFRDDVVASSLGRKSCARSMNNKKLATVVLGTG